VEEKSRCPLIIAVSEGETLGSRMPGEGPHHYSCTPQPPHRFRKAEEGVALPSMVISQARVRRFEKVRKRRARAVKKILVCACRWFNFINFCRCHQWGNHLA